MDKSQFLGLLFIFLLLFFYFHFFSPKPISHNNKNFQNEKELIKYEKLFYDNSYNSLNENKKSFNLVFSNFISGKQKDFVLENNLIKVRFNSKGGLIKKVILKKYKDYNFLPLILLDSQSNEMFLEFIFNNVSFHTNDLFFETLIVNSIANKYQVAKLIFTLNISDNSYLRQIFSIPFNEYSVGYRLKFFGMKSYLDSDLINFL
jgi:YidC/Oxa1 family membrane protein insertase